MTRELKQEELRWSCPDEWLTADSTEQIEPSHGIIGQDRAVKALEFGLKTQSLGFNVFATGLTGTGRMTAIEMHLRPLADAGEVPEDLAYVYNFEHPEQPRLLRLRAGRGAILRDRLEREVRELRNNLAGLFEGEKFQHRLELAVEDLKTRQQELIKAFEQRVHEAGFTLVQVQVGSVTRPEILPLVEERAVSLDKLHTLVAEGKLDRARLEVMEARHGELSEELQRVFAEVMLLREQMIARAGLLRRSTLEPLLKRGAEVIARAVDDPRALPFLEDVAQDVLRDLETVAERASEGDQAEFLLRYAVNVVVDNGATRGRPVIMETEPTFGNLFGTVETRIGPHMQGTSDHTRIRAGSLLRANGGFLVINAFDAISEAGVWPALKRALRFRRVMLRSRETVFALTGQALQPEAAPLDVKVVMLGDRQLYNLLSEMDEEFRNIFKVLADFDSEMPSSRERVTDFLALMARIIHDEELPHLDRSGMAALLEEGVRLAHNRHRLSARFSEVADILREAAYLARAAGVERVSADAIRAAVRARRDRHSLPEEKLTSFMLDRVLVIETSGAAVGQINGLAVFDLGYHAFGIPHRITARVSPGKEGVVNIEREARMSGSTHDKGVLILTGFMRGTFAASSPLSMSASIAFEQSYSGVDGDSASSTEVYAILSALSGLAIRQDVAVTGSVDQAGCIQAIGGVNEKIEGFFALCRERELTGTQGVMIPAANVADLQLHAEVVEAVAAGRFHIWAVQRVEEGIELLTGVPAGAPGADGGFPAGSVFERCARRLTAMAETLRALRET